jgi:hypothetical protein
MTSKTRIRINPALVIACLALFAALAGSAVASGVVGKNSVRSPQIVDGAVRNVDIHNGAIGQTKISPGAVGSDQIADESVSALDLGPASVGSSEVADQSLSDQDLGSGSVGSTELQGGAVRAQNLGPMFQVSNAVTINAGDNAAVTATCPAGTTVVSGGGLPGLYTVNLVGSLRSGNGWEALAHSAAANSTTLTAFAYCLSGGSSN